MTDEEKARIAGETKLSLVEQRNLDAALAQIDRAFGKGATKQPALVTYENDDELTPEEQRVHDRRQAEWNAMTKEQQDASWAAWEAEHCPNGVPF